MIAALLLAAAAPSSLTLEEKAAQLQNAAPAQPKLGLPAYDWWSEGLHGIARNGEATVFPQAIGLAATWDEDLMRRVGDVVATEARAKFNALPKGSGSGLFEGLTIWSPNINIFRDPRWGRGQETYGEDPVLTGRLATAFIQGLQGPDPAHPKVIATPKHFVVHSGPEAGRDTFDVDVSPRDLEATYLPAFRMGVTQGKARSLMCAYNAIHGLPVCASSPLLIDRLRRDWGFNGFTVSDCDAVANIHLFHFSQPDSAHAAAAALKGGTDLNCGSTYSALPEAVRTGLVDEATLDTSLERLVAARRALGITADSSSPWSRIKPSEVGTPAHRALALEAARKSIVLLGNAGGTLPLGKAHIAVIGADADDLGVLEANYHGTAIQPVTPLDGIRKRLGAANVTYAQGSLLAEGAPVVLPETALRSNGKPGLTVKVRNASGKLVRSGRDRRIDFNYTRTAPFRATWAGEFVPPGPGRYTLRLDGPACWRACPPHDSVRLWIGDEKRIDATIGSGSLDTGVEGGAPLPIRVEIDHRGGDQGLRLQWIAPSDVQRAEALAATRDADAIVAVVGLSPDLEGEALSLAVPGFAGGDRTEIELPRPQRQLLKSLQSTGKPLIVVLTSGSAIALGDLKPAAVLAAWYPGVEGGTALAEILFGDVNPSGRLPVTFYASTADLPAFVDYNMKGRTYRYFGGKPEWGFGHGLSYTRFDYAGAALSAASIVAGQSLSATVSVANSGLRSGDEVVEAYLVPPDAGTEGGFTDPILRHQLVGFQRLSLKPGDRRAASFLIDPRLMSSVDRNGTRRVLPGEYRLWIGGGQPGDGPGVWTRFTVTGNPADLPK